MALRRAAFGFRADFPDFLLLAPFRLAIDSPFRNLDSLTISVVLSVAYRNSEKLSGRPAPAQTTAGNLRSKTRSDTGGRARHGERSRREHSGCGRRGRNDRATGTRRTHG